MGMDNELAILFADVVGSVQLYERLGDLPAREKIRTCIEVMRAAIADHQGTLIKTMGDGLMATFPYASDAAAAAVQMQEQVSSHVKLKVDDKPLAIKVGFHYGPVVLDNRDVNGVTVNVASRVMNEAKGDQIITTSATASRLRAYEWSTRSIGPVKLRGINALMDLMEVIWRHEDVTLAGPINLHIIRPGVKLHLWMKDRVIVLDENTRRMDIGRDELNDCVVPGESISRQHASIEIRDNKFVLTDRSTNGTFVKIDGREDFIRRGSVPLDGRGMIGLGNRPDQDSPSTICFHCEEGWRDSPPGF